MKKIEKRFDIHYDLSNWNYNTEIKQIRQDLDIIESLGATHIEFCSYDEISVIPFCNRFETNEEAERRYRIDKYKTEIQEKEDLKLLEKLKLKYENK